MNKPCMGCMYFNTCVDPERTEECMGRKPAIHDEYYGRMPDPEELAKQLDVYIEWIEICLEEDCERNTELDMQAQRDAAKVVRANIKRVYEV